MKLVLVAHRRGAAFEIADVGALIGDDQRALELAGLAGIDAEIGGELHRATHARRYINKAAVREDGGIERGEEIVRHRHHAAQIFLHQLAVIADGFGDRAEDHPGFVQLGLEGRGHRHGIEHRVDCDTRQ